MADTSQAFQWSGIDNQGKRVNGVVQASDVKDAQNELKKMGIEVINLQQKKNIAILNFKFGGKKKIKQEDVLLFTRYLSTMIAAGLPILQALDILAKDQSNPAMQSLLTTIKGNVAGGKTLAESFGQYPDQFGDLYCSLIKAGEKSGTLDKILKRLNIYLERTEGLKKKVKKAMVYPCAIIVVALVVSLILLIFVVPQFQTMFKSFGAELPAFTRGVIAMSDAVRSYWYIMLLAIGGFIFWIRNAIKKNPAVQNYIDRKILNIYVIGPILKKSIIARFTRTLATTLDAGMPIVEAMKSMNQIMGNKLYGDAATTICNEVVSGHQLSSSMQGTGLFPNLAIQMISVGEASGSLSEMLNKVADYYEEEVNNTVDNLSSLLEPLIMMVLGVLIGGFVVAMYLPIFKLGSLF